MKYLVRKTENKFEIEYSHIKMTVVLRDEKTDKCRNLKKFKILNGFLKLCHQLTDFKNGYKK